MKEITVFNIGMGIVAGVILIIGLLFLSSNGPYRSVHYADRVKDIRYLVIHSFSLPVPDMVRRLDELKVSTHYLIDTKGKISQLVPEGKVAWHAGKSYWRGENGLNASSIGIELQNDTLGQTPFSEAQLRAFQNLALDLMKRYHIDPRNVVAHSDIAPTRKTDVGKAFPWREMAELGIGIWAPIDTIAPTGAEDIGQLLAQIGYDTTDVQKALLAFERHFMPELVATDTDIAHMEENLEKLEPIDTPTVRRRLAEIARAFQ